MAPTFVSLDVETANAHRRSICSVGCVRFEHNAIADEYYTLINPCEPFNPANTHIHGLCADQVRDAPRFPNVLDDLRNFIGEAPVVQHSTFDSGAVQQAAEHWRIDPPAWQWFDSIEAARRAWPHFAANGGYGLKHLSAQLGIPLRHHHALDDARAAGQVILKAIHQQRASNFDDLQRKLNLTPRGPNGAILPTAPVNGPLNGPLNGHVVVFSGKFTELNQRIKQRMLAARAAELGARVADRVTARTTLFVIAGGKIGENPTRAAQTACRIARQDGTLRIISEYDFYVLCTPNQQPLL